MTPDEEGFFRTILDNPDDDTPRLVYADWLEDHGETERAEFIRVQCELASLSRDCPGDPTLEAREAALQTGYEQALEYLKDIFPDHLITWQFNRGIPSIGLDGREFRCLAATACPQVALIAINLVTSGLDELAAIATSPLLNRVVSLSHFYGRCDADGMRLLLAVARQMRLYKLHLGHAETFNAQAMRALCEWPQLDGISWLGFSFCCLTDTEVSVLAEAPFLSKLQWLQLNGNQLTDKSTHVLATSRFLPRLRWVGLSGWDHQISRAGFERLAASAALPALEVIRTGNRHTAADDKREVQLLPGRFRTIALVPDDADGCWWR